jgi:hypothetical protein
MQVGIAVQAHLETQVGLAVQAHLRVEVELRQEEQVQAAPSAG